MDCAVQSYLSKINIIINTYIIKYNNFDDGEYNELFDNIICDICDNNCICISATITILNKKIIKLVKYEKNGGMLYCDIKNNEVLQCSEFDEFGNNIFTMLEYAPISNNNNYKWLKYISNKFECTICLKNPVDVITSCNHNICKECFSKWTIHNNSCPFCRKIFL